MVDLIIITSCSLLVRNNGLRTSKAVVCCTNAVRVADGKTCGSRKLLCWWINCMNATALNLAIYRDQALDRVVCQEHMDCMLNQKLLVSNRTTKPCAATLYLLRAKRLVVCSLSQCLTFQFWWKVCCELSEVGQLSPQIKLGAVEQY